MAAIRARIERAPLVLLLAAAGAALFALLVVIAWWAWNDLDRAKVPAQASASVPVPAGASGPISVTALEPVWIKVYEKGGEAMFMGELAAGQSYELPPDAADPMLWTGRPHGVEVRIGDTLLPVLGPHDKPLKDISLRRDALLSRLPPPLEG